MQWLRICDLNRRLNKKGSLTEGGYYDHASTSIIGIIKNNMMVNHIIQR